MMSWIYLHKLADVIFGVIQKLLYITKLGQVMHHYYRNFSERLVTSFRLLFSFIITSLKRGWDRKKKINLTFLRLFNNPLSQYLIFRIISCMKCFFWVIYQNWKWDWGSLLVHICFHKNASYLVLYQLAKFKCQTFFPSQDIK